ncbi:MAG: glycosyltransferase family 9 protein [Dehalococcoidia bacterium]|nr:glycosyltransferase family 9 protein [Dehalococcoidia bacterium]
MRRRFRRTALDASQPHAHPGASQGGAPRSRARPPVNGTTAALPSTPIAPHEPPPSVRGQRIPGVERIAVLRAGGLGDLVFALPALHALRQAYPHASVTLLCAPAHVALLGGRPGPWDEMVVVPPFPGVRDVPGEVAPQAEVERFFEAMRARRFDLAVQMHGGGRHSNPFVLRLGARVTLGCRTPDAEALDLWMPHVYLHSEALRWQELVALVGAEPRGLAPSLAVTSADRRAALEATGPPRPFEVTLHPGAGSPRRRWRAERFAALGDRLVEAGATVYIVGAEAERELTAEVLSQMRRPAVDLGGRLSLPALLGLFDRVALHVGNDSGPAHLARSVARRTLALFWGPNLLTAGPIGPADRHRAVLAWDLACSECGRRLVESECSHESTLLDEIEVERVAAEAFDLLASPADARVALGPSGTPRALRGW